MVPTALHNDRISGNGLRSGTFSSPRLLFLLLASSCIAPISTFAQDADDDEISGEAAVLRSILVRERSVERELARAEKELSAARLTEGIRSLQNLLDKSVDTFLWLPGSGQPVSARQRALELLAKSGSDGLKLYRDLFEGSARDLLRDGEVAGQPARDREVLVRFFLTRSSFVAVDRLASRAFLRGDANSAAALWRRVVFQKAFENEFTLPHLKKIHAVAAAAGDTRLLNEVSRLAMQRFPREMLGDSRIQSPKAGPLRLAVEWPMLFGDPQRSASASVGPPHLMPVWSVPFNRSSDPERNREFQNWLESRDDLTHTWCTSSYPVVTGNAVVFRDYEGIRAVSLRTGETLFTGETATSLAKLSLPQRINDDPVNGPFRRANPRADRLPIATSAEMGVAFAENSVVVTLSSDGQRLFAIDSLDLYPPRAVPRDAGGAADPNETPERKNRSANYLCAYELTDNESRATARKPLWKVGGPETAKATGRSPLAGAFFLGPPLVDDDRLFVLCEIDRQLSAAALSAETGELEWIQGLGYVDRPIESDEFRSTQACVPVLADKILLCPTHAGFLVALDSETGTLLWAKLSGQDRSDARSGFFGNPSRSLQTDKGIPAAPVVAEGRAILLPPHDHHIHCLELATGKEFWTVDRRDGQFIGSVAEGIVVVVGWRSIRGIDLQSGKERWAVRSMPPAGTGFRSGSQYHLPLQTGVVASIELRAGRLRTSRPPLNSGPLSSHTHSDEPFRLGNLIPAGDLILSCGPEAVTAFRAADILLQESLADLKSQPPTEPLQLQVAELQLIAGDAAAGKSSLRKLLAAGIQGDSRLRAESSLRDALYEELIESPADRTKVLAEIERLATTPAERARYLIQVAEDQARRQDFPGVLATAHDFARLHAHEPVSMDGNPLHRISSASVIPTLVRRARHRLSDEERQNVEMRVQTERDQVLSRRDRSQLEAFLSVYSQWPEADAARQELAMQFSEAGLDQRAELLLMQTSESRDPNVARDSQAALVHLWDKRGLHFSAARLMDDLTHTNANDPVGAFPTAAAWLKSWPEDSITRALVRQFAPLDYPVSRVAISEDRYAASDWRMEESFKNYRRRFPTPMDSPFHLLDKGTATDSRISIVDRHTGSTLGTLVVPTRHSYPSTPRLGFTGNFFPLGSEGHANGVSLLERNGESPYWSTALTGAPSRNEIARAGPSGASFAIFQSRQYLASLDPGTGELLWDRADIDPSSGLITDPYAGLFGDDEAIILFHADRVSYTVYRTSTGEEIRQGRLDVDLGLQRRVFGRNLLFTADGGEKELRLWDALTDQVLMKVAVQDRIFTAITPDDDLVVITPPGRVQLFSTATGELKQSVLLPGLDFLNLSFVRAFTDQETLYINLQRDMRSPAMQNFSYYVSDMFLPSSPVQGEFLAIDRASGRLRWKRFMPQRSILNLSHHRLPFLITLSRMRDRSNGSRQSLLVEVLDKQTGTTLGMRDNLSPDRLLLWNYDPAHGRIELSGLQTMIRLDFGRRFQHQFQERDEAVY